MNYFESHAHYDDPRFDCDRDGILAETHDAGVGVIINVGSDLESSAKSVMLAEKYGFIYASLGVHPHEAASMADIDLRTLGDMAQNPKAVAIGEIGLDYYFDNPYNTSDKETQRKRFIDQLKLADELALPVIIHSRDAAQETFDILKKSGMGKKRGGSVHCFSGSAEMAVEYVRMGFSIGVGGVITYKNARNLIETVQAVSLENLLIETDSPYLSPVPNRGLRNNSQNLRYISEKIGEIIQVPHGEVVSKTYENGVSIFLKK